MRWRDSVIASITVIYLRKRIKIAPEATVGGRWRWLVTTAAWETASLVCCQERSAEPERNPNLCAPDEVINNRGQRRWRRLLCLSLSGKRSRRMRWDELVGGWRNVMGAAEKVTEMYILLMGWCRREWDEMGLQRDGVVICHMNVSGDK